MRRLKPEDEKLAPEERLLRLVAHKRFVAAQRAVARYFLPCGDLGLRVPARAPRKPVASTERYVWQPQDGRRVAVHGLPNLAGALLAVKDNYLGKVKLDSGGIVYVHVEWLAGYRVSKRKATTSAKRESYAQEEVENEF